MTITQIENNITKLLKNFSQDTFVYDLLLAYGEPKATISRLQKAFPYVNGGLFGDKFPLPKFTTKSRNILIEIGTLNWSEINPDIFGSMIQAVVTPEHRGDMGMHYTSVPNIMKVMQPLFLDELYGEFENSKTSKTKLQNLITRIANLKIFDPACGSGNFLIIAYKELRRLEMKILSAIDSLSTQKSFTFSEIKLTGFYGIELDDFAHEVAILSLWLAEHQMNLEFYKAFGRTLPSLPLHDGGNIVHGNATRLDWEVVCPKEDGDEIYILGNPPYLGFKMQNKEQKEDMECVFREIKNYKKLDYIACWFYKGAKYIKNENAQYAFVSTNSISQGEQIGILWTHLLKDDLEIDFAYQSFNWTNNAKSNAAVIVVVIGLRNISSKTKYLYKTNIKQEVKNFRLASTDKSANEMGKTPFKFREQHEAKSISIIIPTVTSERREYIPMGYLDKNSIVVAPNNVLYDPEPYVFGILSSKVHTLWVKAVGGKLKSDYRYSSVLCYNTFPFPNITKKQKEELTELVYNILDEREQHSEKTLAQLYDPDKMPPDLKQAHHQLDIAIEKCYRNKPFENDEERLEYLFKMYEEMIKAEVK